MSTEAFDDGPIFFSTSMKRQSYLWTSDALLRAVATSIPSYYLQLLIRLADLASFERSPSPCIDVVEETMLSWGWQLARFTESSRVVLRCPYVLKEASGEVSGTIRK